MRWPELETPEKNQVFQIFKFMAHGERRIGSGDIPSSPPREVFKRIKRIKEIKRAAVNPLRACGL